MRSILSARLALVGLVVLATLLPAGAVWAVPPEQETFVFDSDVPLVECPDFWVWAQEVIKWHVLDFYDGDGNWLRTQVHWSIEGAWYNPAYPDSGLEEMPSHYTITFDQEGQATWVGVVQNINLPGAGPIFFGAGKMVFDADGNVTFWAGPNDYLEGDLDALCSALSGP